MQYENNNYLLNIWIFNVTIVYKFYCIHIEFDKGNKVNNFISNEV